MSASIGPRSNTNGLILHVDFLNRKSFIELSGSQRSLINTANWALGSGGVAGFSANGQGAESQRVTDTDPFGTPTVVWETRPTGDGGADGGWEGSFFNIDNTKLYRSVVWVRRTSSTSGGNFYHGLHTNGTGDTLRLSDSGSETNPYWDYRGPGSLTQNQWYLNVGHIYPAGTTQTSAHPDSGFWTTGGTKVISNAGNVPGDVKFPTNATQAYQRVYHYYCGDTTTRLQFAYPRWDVIDGSEPTIAELLSKSPNQAYDLSGNGNHMTIAGYPSYSGNDGWQFTTGQTAKYFQKTSLAHPTTTMSAEIWVKTTTPGTGIYSYSSPSFDNDNLIFDPGNLSVYVPGNAVSSGISITDGVWRHIVRTSNRSTGAEILYINGVAAWNSTVSPGTLFNTNGSLVLGHDQDTLGPTGGGFDPNQALGGSIQTFKLYNRVLTADEVNQNFNMQRGRFGI